MSIETVFNNWQLHVPADDPKFNRCSPNLIAVGWEMARRWGMTDMGCYVERDVRNGTLPSSHSHGAARDLRYGEGRRALALNQIIPWLINYSRELHIQAIHDYFGSRIWRAGRTANKADAHSAWWKPQPVSPATGMGQPWALYFHIETTEYGWPDSTPAAARLGAGSPPPTTPPDPIPVPPIGGEYVFNRVIKPGDTGPDVAFIQVVLRAPGSATGNKDIVADGKYGAQTVQAVQNVQKFTGLEPDGLIGPKTQAVFLTLANS